MKVESRLEYIKHLKAGGRSLVDAADIVKAEEEDAAAILFVESTALKFDPYRNRDGRVKRMAESLAVFMYPREV